MLTKCISIFGTILCLMVFIPGMSWAGEPADFIYNLSEPQENQGEPGIQVGPGPAEGQNRKNLLGVGWQHTKPASGFSVKFPVYDEYYLQPLLSFSIDRKNGDTSGKIDYGLRGLYLLPDEGYIQPYTGIGWGRTESYDSGQREYGYEVFIGAEYKEFLLVPAIEVGLGGFSKSDGSFHAGTTLNFSVFYYF
ncbi:MAG TPA: hypothetical protein GXZ36_02635 [Firmicutes bacterium]|nr:hypothetical protein [Bacillota bacterium]